MTHRDLYLAYVRAYNTKDVDGMLVFFDENCVFENVSAGKPNVVTQGKAALEALARKSAAAFHSREQKVLSITEGQGRVAAEIEFVGTLQDDLSPGLKAGGRLQLRGVSVLEFAGEKIVRLTDYS